VTKIWLSPFKVCQRTEGFLNALGIARVVNIDEESSADDLIILVLPALDTEIQRLLECNPTKDFSISSYFRSGFEQLSSISSKSKNAFILPEFLVDHLNEDIILTLVKDGKVSLPIDPKIVCDQITNSDNLSSFMSLQLLRDDPDLMSIYDSLGKSSLFENLYDSRFMRRISDSCPKADFIFTLLASSESKVKTALEDTELTLLQLQQVQQELEYYFFQSRGKDDLLKKYNTQQQRLINLIPKAIS